MSIEQTRPTAGRRERTKQADRLVFGAFLFLLVALGTLGAFAHPLNWDAGWYLEVADQVLDGRRLYVDLVDVNPPLIVWMSGLPVLAARVTGLPVPVAFGLGVLGLFAEAFLLSYLVLRDGWRSHRLLRWSVLVALPVALLGFVSIDFGEREHLLALLIAPYLLLAGARAAGEGTPAATAVAIGGLAGVGFALKPHFLLTLLAIEAYLIVRQGVGRWLARPELWAGAGALSLYAGAVLLLTPEYIDVIRLAASSYLPQTESLSTLVLRSEVSFAAVAVLAALLLRSRPAARGLADVLSVSVGAFVAVAILQGKGWGYHYYPAVFCSVLLIGPAVAAFAGRSGGPRGRVGLGVLALLGTTVLAQAAAPVIVRSPPHPVRELATVIDAMDADDVVVLSTELGASFPLVNYAGVRWASRFPSLWFIPAFYAGAADVDGRYLFRAPDEMQATERRLFDTVVKDFTDRRPDVVLVVERRGEPGFPNGSFDYLAYYNQHPGFAATFASYERVATLRPYTIYRDTNPPPSTD